MTKWKRPDIVANTEDRCVDHTFSVMRLALNYKTGLPGEWKKYEGRRSWQEVCEVAFLTFPKHAVMCIDTNTTGVYMASFWDDYLLAFAYIEKGSPDSRPAHMVIGYPTTVAGMSLYGVIAVSIERKWK